VCGFAVLFAGVGIRAGQLTVLHGRHLARLADQQHRGQIDLTPRRGPIVDRSGQLLASTVDAQSVYAEPEALRREPRKFAALARALGVPVGVVEHKAETGAPFVWLKRRATPKEITAVTAVGAPGVSTLPEGRRVYPHLSLAAHVLGAAGVDAQGLEGVEREYDAFIRPPAQVIEATRDARGRHLFTAGLGPDEAPTGARVELTLDAAYQAVAERELTRGVERAGARSGTAIVLDPWTGAVLALANVPSFDPNSVGASDPAARRNRALTDMYEPGSTLKAMLAAAAIDQGVASRQASIFCERGRYAVAGRVIHDHHPHGVLTFADVIRFSSNIGTAKVAERLGAQRFYAYLRSFGFGEKTGINLPGEVAGQLREADRWTAIDLATASFGQGVAVTPMQMARAFAVLANGGVLVRPYVVERVVASDGIVLVRHRPQTPRRVIRQETARTVAALLRGAVENGTGTLAGVPGVAVAGKTGTAQKVDPATGRYSTSARVASFVGFVPAEKPRVVVLVLIDEPTTSRYGGTVAAPVFREIAQALIAREGIETSIGKAVQEVRGGGAGGGRVGFLDPGPRAAHDRPEVRV
jgi:cell division protein FtsI (penicillin-binding protein 3)